MANNSTDIPWSWEIEEGISKPWTILMATSIVFVIAGISINWWLVASIVTSRDLRARLRHQLICSIGILHLFYDIFVSTIVIVILYHFRHQEYSFNCHLLTYTIILRITCSIISDLLVVTLASAFLGQVLGIDPASKLRTLQLTVARAALLAFPWVFAGIVGPLSVIRISKKMLGCFTTNELKYHMMEMAFTISPLSVATLIIALVVVLICARFGRGRITAHGDMGVQLILGSGPEMDNSLAIIGAVLVCAARETCIFVLWVKREDLDVLGSLLKVSELLVESCSCILLPLMFLFLQDLRQRIKVWRPWRPNVQASGINLTEFETRRIE
ncbi:hypothetical protein RRG08_060253 [Elysia crispata]|uniref:Uncharacterized protein n=1 Tax=Elysia crispata TaxID=231223 RepID=A0AAE1B8L8_9GAST|nr:hypothetical protein RRG08_060253 [Elysia crispata]